MCKRDFLSNAFGQSLKLRRLRVRIAVFFLCAGFLLSWHVVSAKPFEPQQASALASGAAYKKNAANTNITTVNTNISNARSIAKPASQVISFLNFDRSFSIDSHLRTAILSDGIHASMTNQLIVKLPSEVIPQNVFNSYKYILDSKTIFTGKTFTYYRLAVLKRRYAEVFHALKKNKHVLLIQPDLVLKSNIAKGSQPSVVTQRLPRVHNSKRIDDDEQSLQATGRGINIAIIDDGFFTGHPALQHIQTTFEYDVETRMQSAEPKNQQDHHGTRVAGVIFSKSYANTALIASARILPTPPSHITPVSGIAPEANLIAIRSPYSRTSDTLLSLHLAQLAGADIINCSWNSPLLLEPIADAINHLAENGRSGKGIAVVIAAGNEGRLITEQSIEASLDQAIVVGAYTSEQRRLKSSNYGPSIDLWASGDSVRALSASGGYTRFSGTSLAAATVSGLAAIALSEDSDLTLQELEQKIITLNHVIPATLMKKPN